MALWSARRSGTSGIGGSSTVRESDDRAADGDAFTRFERADDGAVHVAVGRELASAAFVFAADVAQRIVELEAGDDDLEALGLDRLVGADDVERQLTVRLLGLGQGVRQHVTVLAAHCLVRVADPDLGLEPPVVDEDVGGRVG